MEQNEKSNVNLNVCGFFRLLFLRHLQLQPKKQTMMQPRRRKKRRSPRRQTVPPLRRKRWKMKRPKKLWNLSQTLLLQEKSSISKSLQKISSARLPMPSVHSRKQSLTSGKKLLNIRTWGRYFYVPTIYSFQIQPGRVFARCPSSRIDQSQRGL